MAVDSRFLVHINVDGPVKSFFRPHMAIYPKRKGVEAASSRDHPIASRLDAAPTNNRPRLEDVSLEVEIPFLLSSPRRRGSIVIRQLWIALKPHYVPRLRGYDTRGNFLMVHQR
jgi:hypothetical protein